MSRRQERKYPRTSLYLDIHAKVDGRTADALAQAHRKVFCLAHAPSKEAFMAVHREAHGLVADRIVEVKEGS